MKLRLPFNRRPDQPPNGSAAAGEASLEEPTGPGAGALIQLRERGIAVVPFSDLCSERLWAAAAADIDGFAEEVAARTSVPRDGPATKDDYLIRRWGHLAKQRMKTPTPSLRADSPWLQVALSDVLLGVVNAYRGGPSRLVDLDQWYTVPFGARHDRVASQRWHRDPEDQHVLKVFTYFSDVDGDSGPFQYVPSSAKGGRYGDLYPWGESKWYPPQDELAERIPESEHFSAEGPRGTVVLCDTSGLHRGGFARATPRVMSYFTFVSPEAEMVRRFAVEASEADAHLSEHARLALA